MQLVAGMQTVEVCSGALFSSKGNVVVLGSNSVPRESNDSSTGKPFDLQDKSHTGCIYTGHLWGSGTLSCDGGFSVPCPAVLNHDPTFCGPKASPLPAYLLMASCLL